MRVECRLFADLRRHAPADSERGRFEVELPDEARVRDLLEQAGIPADTTQILLVNGQTGAGLATVLSEGDVVSIFPPVSGG